jgi:hypothetical protein
VADQIAEEADRQLYDEDHIKRELVQLEIDAEEDRIGPTERLAKENELLERLAVARQRQVEEAAFEADPPWVEKESEGETNPTLEERAGDG